MKHQQVLTSILGINPRNVFGQKLKFNKFFLFIRIRSWVNFKHLQHDSPLDLLMKVDKPCTYVTRRTEKGLLPIEFSRTKIKSTSIENILRKGYNLMKEFNLIPENLNDSSIQVRNWFKKISDTLVGGTTLVKFFHPE